MIRREENLDESANIGRELDSDRSDEEEAGDSGTKLVVKRAGLERLTPSHKRSIVELNEVQGHGFLRA